MSDAEPNNTQDHAEQNDNQPINIKVRPRRSTRPGLPPGVACYRGHRPLTTCRSRSQVTTQNGEEVFFKIKRNTRLSKLQGAYANKVGKDVSSIR